MRVTPTVIGVDAGVIPLAGTWALMNPEYVPTLKVPGAATTVIVPEGDSVVPFPGEIASQSPPLCVLRAAAKFSGEPELLTTSGLVCIPDPTAAVNASVVLGVKDRSEVVVTRSVTGIFTVVNPTALMARFPVYNAGCSPLVKIEARYVAGVVFCN